MKKVLIIAGGLQIGGAERVAANISKYAPDDQFEFHYLVFEGLNNDYGPEIESKGGTVFTIPLPSKGYAAYYKTLCDLMKKHQYIAVHSHTMFNSGLNLLAAKMRGVPCRIAHSHTTKTEVKVSFWQKLYENTMRLIILFTATDYFSCGVEAGYWMFGERLFKKKGVVITNGIEIQAYLWSEEKRETIRRRYGLQNSFVIGHAGSILPLKNQIQLLQWMPEILKRIPNAKLMLLGGGSTSYVQELQKLACELGINDAVIFCGSINNVSDYLNAFDVFVFPSLREGTPLALIEAQTNGLPCIISECVPMDAQLTELIQVIPLNNQDAWVDAICHAKRTGKDYSDMIAAKGFCAESAYQPIYEAYAR